MSPPSPGSKKRWSLPPLGAAAWLGALLLYGMSMIYGATGSLELGGVAQAMYQGHAEKPVLVFGLVFLVAGVAFKLGLVPFHMWSPPRWNGRSMLR